MGDERVGVGVPEGVKVYNVDGVGAEHPPGLEDVVLLSDLPAIRKQEWERVREALGPMLQVLDLEIERCQELGDVWAEEGIDADFPADPEDRARFFRGQHDKLKGVRSELAALNIPEDSDA